MHAIKAKRNLFGGALRCAGLATTTIMTSGAVADFSPLAPPGSGSTINTVSGYAYGPSAFASFYDSTYAASFTVPQSYTGPGLSMSAYSGATSMGATIDITDSAIWSYARVLNVQWFGIATGTKDITFEWDFTSASYGYSYVYQIGYGAVSPIGYTGGSGSTTLTLTASNTYAFVAAINQFSADGGGYARISNVPAPGALGLLGLGALTTRRRRRRV